MLQYKSSKKIYKKARFYPNPMCNRVLKCIKEAENTTKCVIPGQKLKKVLALSNFGCHYADVGFGKTDKREEKGGSYEWYSCNERNR